MPRAVVLDAWTASRVDKPERAYEKYFICKSSHDFSKQNPVQLSKTIKRRVCKCESRLWNVTGDGLVLQEIAKGLS